MSCAFLKQCTKLDKISLLSHSCQKCTASIYSLENAHTSKLRDILKSKWAVLFTVARITEIKDEN